MAKYEYVLGDMYGSMQGCFRAYPAESGRENLPRPNSQAYHQNKMAASRSMKYAMRKRLVILSLILVVVDGVYLVGDKLDCAVDISSFEVLSVLKRLQSGCSHLRVGTSYRLKISRRILGFLQHLHNSIVVSYISSCIPISSLLILLSGDVESNPGPGPKFPCGVCSRAVKLNQKGIQCDACDVWFHTKCDRLPDSEYMRLTNTEDPWYCSTCSLPPLSDSFFDTPDLNDSLNDTGNSCIDDSDASLPPYFCVPPTLSTSLLMSHLNIRSMLPKLDDVRLFLKQHKHGFVFGLSETWLSGNVTNTEVAIEGFNLYRRDRTNGSMGGGVAVYVSNNICSSRRRDLEEDSIEAIWVQLKLKKSQILFCNLYRPPSSTSEWMDNVTVMIEKANLENLPLVVCGDFNCDMLSLPTQSKRLQVIMSNYGLTQLVTDPTRVTRNTESMIDLLYTTNPEMFDRMVCHDLGISDHSLILGAINSTTGQRAQKFRQVRCYGKCNLDKLLQELKAAPWHIMDRFPSMNSKWEFWKATFLNIVDANIPLVKTRVRDKSMPWISREIRMLMRKRSYQCTKAKKSKKAEDWARYKTLRNEVTTKLRQAKLSYFTELSNKPPTFCKKVWTEVNRLLGKTSQQINKLITEECKFTEPHSIANAFSSHFSTTLSNTIGNPHADTCAHIHTLDSVFKFSPVSEEDVLQLLSSIDVNKAIGVDAISGKLVF